MSTIEKALAKRQQQSGQTPQNEVEQTPVEKQYSGSDQLNQEQQDKSFSQATSNNSTLDIDTQDLAERGFLIDTGMRKSIKDEFRQIKRKLLNNAFGAGSKMLTNGNLVMVSSSKPNEGKTFVSINLALSIALEQDKTVLLIDADVLRPSVNRELGISSRPGLIEYLLGEISDLSEILYSTNINKLKIIPAGEPHHLSNELLASDKMAALAQELANRYPDRIVLFDCPPLIGVTETLVLANLMGQALVVVEESKTKLADIKQATESINENVAVGLVLNKATRSHRDMYGYYGYGYDAK